MSASRQRGAIAAAIGGGSLELGIGDLVSGVNAITAGLPDSLARRQQDVHLETKRHHSGWRVAKESAIQRARDLAGKSISVPTLVGIGTSALRAWLSQNGVDPATVKLGEANVGGPARCNGTIDRVSLRTYHAEPQRRAGRPPDGRDAESSAFPVWCVKELDRSKTGIALGAR